MKNLNVGHEMNTCPVPPVPPQASQPAGSLPGTAASAPAVPPGAVMVEGALVFLSCEDREVEEAARAALRDAFPQVSGRSCRAAQGPAGRCGRWW